MLTSNSTLRQSRYHITDKFWGTASHSLYEAHDDLFAQDVIIHEGSNPRSGRPGVFDRDADERRFTARFNRLRSLSHRGLIGVREHFYHAECKYLVSDTTDGSSICQIVGSGFAPLKEEKVVKGAEHVMDALAGIASLDETIKCFDTDPGNIRVTRNGELKFLYFGTDAAAGGRTRVDISSVPNTFAFFPLEIIWTGLDPASQNAIAHSYGQTSVDLLESAPDLRTDIFTLGSIFYYLLTGKLPLDALERSIELLDGKPDPLIAPHQLIEGVSSEFSALIVRAMCLKREDRFENFETIRRQLTALDRYPAILSNSVLLDFDDIELLEIPEFKSVRPMNIRTQTEHSSGVAVNALLTHPPTISNREIFPEQVEPRFNWPTDHHERSTDVVEPSAAMADDEIRNDVASPAVPVFGDDHSFLTERPPRRRSKLSPVAIGAALVVTLGIGVWIYLSILSSGIATTTESRPIVTSTATATPAIEPQQIQYQQPGNAAEPPARTVTVNEPAEPTVPATPKTRPMVAETKPKNETRTAGVQNTRKPKKKVTVDDLIRDN